MAVVEIGKFTKTVRFDKSIPVPAGAGYSDVYTELITVMGYMKRTAQSRNLSFGEVTSEASYELQVRFIQDIEDNFDAKMKISIDGKLYTPQGPPEKIEEKRRILKFVITETGRYSGTPTSGTIIFVDQPLYINPVGGEYTVQSDLLKNVTLYLVTRPGANFKPVSGTPGNLEVQYDSSAGSLTFQTALELGEMVTVLYKS